MSTIFEHGYALIVGVNDNRIQRLALPDVEKDVQAVYDVLVHPERCAYKSENVKLLKGEESTRQNILEGLYWLQDKVKGDAEATAVIYYSGHGMVDKNTNQYYLVPYDIQELSRLRAHALRAEDLTAEISDVSAKRMLAILDCCHAGGMDVKDVDLEAIDAAANVEAAAFPLELPETKSVPLFEAVPGEKSVHDLKEGNGRAILNSSTGAQSSFVRTDRKMSLFTYHLIEALTGHAPHPDDATVVYVTDVMSWVTHQVKKSARKQGRDQTPVMKTSGVFPIAQLIGGQGLSKGIGQLPPDPLEPLPPASGGMQAGGNIVSGTAGGDMAGGDINKTTIKKKGGVHIDGGFNMSGGSFVGGDSKVVQGDEVHGDKVGGDQVGGDKISVGDISGGQGIAIGAGAQADVRSSSSSSKGKNENVEEKFSQSRRFEAAIPKSSRVGHTTELLTMIPRFGDPGLKAFLPIETPAGDIIGKEDVSSRDVEIEFPFTKDPVLVFIKIETSKHDFEVENPIKAVKIFPDREGDYETFFLMALREVPRARIVVRLFTDEELQVPVGTLRFDIPIEHDSTGVGERLQQARQQELIFKLAHMPLTYIAGNHVGGDMINATVIGSTGVGVGRDARADVRIQQGSTVDELTPLFAPLLAQAAQENAAAVSQLQALKAEVAKGETADDKKMANLIGDIAKAAPSVVAGIVNLFTNSVVANVAGGITEFVLEGLRK